MDSFLDMVEPRRPVDRMMMRRDLKHFVTTYYRQDFGKLACGSGFDGLMETVRHYHLRLPYDLLLLFKTWAMIEGLATQLDPTASMAMLFAPFVKEWMYAQYSPTAWGHGLRTAMVDVGTLSELPRRVSHLLAELERGTLEVTVRPADYEPLLHRFESLANQLVVAIIAAALIIGVAMLVVVHDPSGTWWRWVGYAFAAAVPGLSLVWKLRRP